jgi:hypothetical protein
MTVRVDLDVDPRALMPGPPVRSGTMRATVGDQMVIQGPRRRARRRYGGIMDVRGRDGEPPFLVRCAYTGHEALMYPGPDAQIHHLHNEERPAQ